MFRADDFETYRGVNARFADVVREEAKGASPIVLVQDYHFALAPQMIHERLPLSTIVAFWHIPWPAARDFDICPWAPQLLKGLLGSHIVGFQTPSDCRNFIDSVESTLEATIDRDRSVVTYAGRQTAVRAYPVSTEWPSRWADRSAPIDACRESVRRELHLDADIQLGVGVDRMDYTKGIAEKFLAVERLLESYPERRGRFVFVQIAEPSRECLQAYREIRSKVWTTAERINARFASGAYRPIVLLEARHEPADVYRYLRAADVCYVGSLHDGMNLVAKEFVSARDDERGVLVLSRFTGAARQLDDALIVNPLAIDDAARALADALSMDDGEQSRRMRRMRSIIAEFSTYWWAGQMLQDAARLRQHRGGGAVRRDLGSGRDSIDQIPSPESRIPAAATTQRLVLREQAVEQVAELREVDRLHDVRVEAGRARAFVIGGLAVAGHRDEPRSLLGRAGAEQLRQLVAVHQRQSEIEQRDIGRKSSAISIAAGPSNATAYRGRSLERVGGQARRRRCRHDENSPAGAHRRARDAAASGGPRGATTPRSLRKRITNSLP